MKRVVLRFDGEQEAIDGGRRIGDAHKGVVIVEIDRDTASFTYADDELGIMFSEALVNTAPKLGVEVLESPFTNQKQEAKQVSV